jgi:Tol biopolymer transport system component/tRNA A-37 threonylcarbamoyl transferase component Bud32
MLKVGGMGAVYEVECEGRRYAVKEMREQFRSNQERQEAVNRFLAEAMTLAKLDHPRIPKVHRHFIEGDRYYLVMDYVEGDDLADVSAQAPGGRLAEEQVLEWGQQICDVLAYLHSRPQPVVFRDMKPSNLMLAPGGEIKLIDFGIAKLFNPAQRHGASLVGTPGYAAPEQYRGVAEPRSDIYGLGATLHHLLTGCDPTDTSQHLFDFASIRDYDPSLSEEIEKVIERALAMKMKDRYESVEEMSRALQQALRPPVPWWKRIGKFFERVAAVRVRPFARPALRWGFLAALLVILGVLAFVVWRPQARLVDTRLAIVSDREGIPKIYVMDQDGRAARLTDHAAEESDPTWSPDKRRIGFASKQDGNWEVYWVNADGTGLMRLTHNSARDIEPAWSPDGRHIAFTSDRDGKREVYVAGPDGMTRITHTPGTGESWDPAWGPKATLLFTSDRDGKREVYQLTQSGQVIRITHTPGDGESWSPAWSWAGSYTAFISDRDGQPEVYVLSTNEEKSRRFSYTRNGSGGWDPAPLGTFLAFTSDRSGKREIHASIQDEIRQLTDTVGSGESWSPAW